MCVSHTTAAHAKGVDAEAAHGKAVELGKHIVRMTTLAGSGHPSSALSLVHIVVELMYRRMRWEPRDPWHRGSDRLVLSVGHAVPVVYAAYADVGGAVGRDQSDARLLTVDDLSTLRELGSAPEGHPNPAEGFPFFDAATGSLGQGLSVAAGLALAARLDGIEKHIYAILGDGESREGQVWEAADFIVDHKLTNVCAVFSCNGHGQAAPVSVQQSAESIAAKMAAFGWDVVTIDGHEPEQIAAAFARFGTTDKPLAIVARTVKGWGVESMLGKNFHGKPMPAADLENACAQLDATAEAPGARVGCVMSPPRPPAVPHSRSLMVAARSGAPVHEITLPPFAEALKRVDLEAALEAKMLATRRAYGAALVALGDVDGRVVALDGDVKNSTFAELFAEKHPDRFFECKIAEQNMISAAVGLSAGGKIPFASSFAKFIARGTDQIDMAGITRANLKIVGSHAGISLGPDGPSQMSLSDVAYFRSMTRVDNGSGGPLCRVFHPADAVAAYRCCELMANVDGLCYMRTHRPAAQFIYPVDERFDLGGCKRLRTGGHLTMVSCGYILHTVLEAGEKLAAAGIECNVFDAYTFPLDASAILDAARASGGVILAIEDNYLGGLHAELAEAAGQLGEVRVVGMTASRVPKSAKTAGEVFSHVGVGLQHIMDRATELAKRRGDRPG
jgi:transketolase